MGGCLVGVGCCAWEADGGKLLLELGLGVMRLMVGWVGGGGGTKKVLARVEALR